MVAFVAMLSTHVGNNRLSAAELTAANVNRAINRGVEYLRSIQNDNGSWDEFTGQSCGLSALCTLSMLNAGVDVGDPAMTSAIKYLRGKTPQETYSVALQTLVFCDLGSPSDLRRIRRNVRWFIENQTESGSWSYGNVGSGGRRGGGDPSNAQFAVLALGAARDRGIEISNDVFDRSTKYWSALQRSSGGWSYTSSGSVTGSMTCAGIASLIISQSNLSVGASSIVGDRIECCGNDDSGDRIERGLTWLGNNFTTAVNPRGGSSSHLYYLYALERTGRLSGRRFIGGHDWYREGADRLLAMQDQFSGYWRGTGPLEPAAVATSFAVLFLAKGRRKVVIGRLRYNVDNQRWRRHSGAIAGLVGHLENAWDQKLTWQTIESERASVDDLLQAPVILITGSDAINLSDQVAQTLGQYIRQGGTILFDADASRGCGDASRFNADVLKLTRQWTDGAAMRKLATDHPVWSVDVPVDFAAMSPNEWVYGVEACCRTSIFYFPESLSCRWALAGATTGSDAETVSNAAKRQIEVTLQIGQNILAYATGRRLKDKLQSSVLVGQDEVPPINRNTIRMATLISDADAAGAGRAAVHAAQFAAGDRDVDISTLEDSIGFNPDVLRDVQYLWVHGRNRIDWNDEQIAVLRQFIDSGGIILASSICGSEAFGESFREIVPILTGGQSLVPIGEDDVLMRMPGGYDLGSVVTRLPPSGQGGGVSTKTGPPRLLWAKSDRNLATIFFSPLDLSCALESPNSIQCPGFDTTDAAKIVTNMVLLGLSQ